MGKDYNMDMLSLFDEDYEAHNQEVLSTAPKLDVVKMDFIQSETLSWEELFAGFDNLYAITYSSGIDFVYRLLDHFEEAVVVFGCEAVMSGSLQEIIAYQTRFMEQLRQSANERQSALLNRLDDGSVHFYVARNVLSHEKIYLLKAKDGRKRVITGSANMSRNAFGGYQRENICYIEGDAAFDWYMQVFQSLVDESTDEITRKAIVCADAADNIEELPISNTVRVRKAVIVEPETNATEEVQFQLDVRNLADKLRPLVPKPDKKTKRLLLSPEIIKKIKRTVKSEQIKEKELRSEYPQLIIDADNLKVSLNEQYLDLSPSEEEIRQDVELFLKYMDGYSKFHGDYQGMQRRYYEFANWFFCTPFMAVMRDIAARYDQQKLPYPVFGLIYGQSKAGKTSFLETLLKMMIGQKPKISAPDFTRSNIEALKRTVLGAPIIVDDLTNTRFNQHAIETIKNDDFGVREHMVNYPAVVISANEDVKAVSAEVIRRTVICHVEAGLTNTEVMRSNVVRSVQQRIGTALYREYLRKMLDRLPDLLETLKDDDSEAPDILHCSSEVLTEIFERFTDSIPDYIRPLNLDNYFSEQVTGKNAINTIRKAWQTSSSSFEIDRKNNELRYNAGATYEADRLLKELPETLVAKKSREWVTMDLDEAQAFFGLRFRKTLFQRIKQ